MTTKFPTYSSKRNIDYNRYIAWFLTQSKDGKSMTNNPNPDPNRTLFWTKTESIKSEINTDEILKSTEV